MDPNTTPAPTAYPINCPKVVRPVKFKARTASADDVAKKLKFTEGMSAAALAGP